MRFFTQKIKFSKFDGYKKTYAENESKISCSDFYTNVNCRVKLF